MILSHVALLLQFPAIPLNFKDHFQCGSTLEMLHPRLLQKAKTATHAPENANLIPEPHAAEGVTLSSNLPSRDSRAAAPLYPQDLDCRIV
jgi:hypothetical protein